MHNTEYKQLTDAQRKAVFHVEGPLLVIAGPGSGKTRVITHRIAALIDAGVQPYNICAITFTNKAAEEMRQRVVALQTQPGAHISTFHSLCVRILRKYADRAKINPNFTVYDAADQKRCVKHAVKDCELDTTNFPPLKMLDAISSLKNNLIDADSFKNTADDFFSKMLADVYQGYEQILFDNNALDFDDLLLKTALLLENCSDVRNELGNRFKFLLIDEYQDTNHAQYKIAKALVSSHNNICATGDPDQSIYRWRGADIRNILDFEQDWPNAVVVNLEENFRSTPNILQAADRLISYNQNRKKKSLIPNKLPKEDVVIEAFEDETFEAQAIAEKIKDLVDKGKKLKEIAVFYRVNSLSRSIEEAFIKNQILYQVVRGVEFYNRKEIRDLLAYLKVLANPDDEIALMRIINTPVRGIGKSTIEKIQGYAVRNNISFYNCLKRAESFEFLSKGLKSKLAAFVDMIEKFKSAALGKVGPLTERVFNESGLAESLKSNDIKDESATENINELINSAHLYDKQAENPSLVEYLQQISLFTDADSYDTTCDRVALMTLHAAKGLEFENVFIIGVEEGLLPHERTKEKDEEIEEERRLLFVGITRAKENLHISYARYRTVRGQQLRTIPSSFLYEMGINISQSCQVNQYCYDNNADDDNYYQSDSEISASIMKGQKVRHDLFGIGIVKSFVNLGDDSIVVVKFNTGQIKELSLKYANLSII